MSIDINKIKSRIIKYIINRDGSQLFCFNGYVYDYVNAYPCSNDSIVSLWDTSGSTDDFFDQIEREGGGELLHIRCEKTHIHKIITKKNAIKNARIFGKDEVELYYHMVQREKCNEEDNNYMYTLIGDVLYPPNIRVFRNGGRYNMHRFPSTEVTAYREC